MRKYDLLVIGAGPGGYETAARAASSGLKVGLIEKDQIGGTCLNRGCIPTKCLCRSAELREWTPVDFASAVARKDEIVDQLREGVATLLDGVDVIEGEARFKTAAVVEVEGHDYTATRIVIATGARPARLDVPGAELAISSDEFLIAASLPQSIVIIGGGVVGMEFVSVLNAFGVKVTVLEYCREILPPLDAEVAKRLRMIMKRKGVDIVTDADITAISPGMTVYYRSKGKDKSVTAERVLMAVGRVPVIPEGLAGLVVVTDRGAIATDSGMRVIWADGHIPPGDVGLYAVGDVNGRCMLAHAATAQGEIVLGEKRNLDVMPSAVFTAPECAMVGHTEDRCHELGIDVVAGRSFFRANGKAMAMGETDGMVKMLVDRKSGCVVGCHICGPHAADLIQEVATVMSAGLPASVISQSIHAHPTLGETLRAAVPEI